MLSLWLHCAGDTVLMVTPMFHANSWGISFSGEQGGKHNTCCFTHPPHPSQPHSMTSHLMNSVAPAPACMHVMASAGCCMWHSPDTTALLCWLPDVSYAGPMVGARLVLPGPYLDGENIYALMDTYRVTVSTGDGTSRISAEGLQFFTCDL